MVSYRQRRLGPQRLWLLSCKLHRRGWTPLARLVKGANYFFFRAILPYEADVADDVQLGHLALGTVIHPHVTIGRRVHLWQGVTLASDAPISDPSSRIVVKDGVEIGAGAVIVNKRGRNLTIGENARVGANAVVTKDVAANVTVVGSPARPVARD
jgi:serine O-acetyltransferase